MFNCIQSGVGRSDHKWPLETHVEAHVNARWEHMRLGLSTCDRIMDFKNRWETGPYSQACGAQVVQH